MLNCDDMRNFLLKLLLPKDLPRGVMAEEQYEMAMSKMYQNPAVMQYLDHRQKYLGAKVIELVVKDQLADSRGVAGQLLEVRAMKNTMRVCYTRRHKEMVKRKQSVSGKRQHSQ